MALNPSVWGPHYWFFLHTISLSYPHYPNAITKKKYYDFIQNIPLFIPVETIASSFSKLLDEYPVSPYLDSKKAFISWMHFIHNKVNEKLGKKKMTLNDFYKTYYNAYKPTALKYKEYYKLKEKIIYIVVIILILALTIYLYKC